MKRNLLLTFAALVMMCGNAWGGNCNQECWTSWSFAGTNVYNFVYKNSPAFDDNIKFNVSKTTVSTLYDGVVDFSGTLIFDWVNVAINRVKCGSGVDCSGACLTGTYTIKSLKYSVDLYINGTFYKNVCSNVVYKCGGSTPSVPYGSTGYNNNKSDPIDITFSIPSSILKTGTNTLTYNVTVNINNAAEYAAYTYDTCWFGVINNPKTKSFSATVTKVDPNPWSDYYVDGTTTKYSSWCLSNNLKKGSVSGLGFERAYYSLCADSAKVVGNFNFKYCNAKCNGYDYGNGDKGEASLAFNSFPVTVTVFSGVTGTQVYEKTFDVKVDNTLPNPPAPSGRGSVYYKELTQSVDLSKYNIMVPLKNMSKGKGVGGYITVKIGTTDKYTETVSSFNPCFSKIANNPVTVANKQSFSLNIDGGGVQGWNKSNVYGQGVTAEDHIVANTGVVSDIKASCEHPDVSCSTKTVRIPVSFDLNWCNYNGKLFDYGGGDKGKASLAFKKFKYHYMVRTWNTYGVPVSTVYSESSYSRHYACKDTGLPSYSNVGEVYSRNITERVKDTLSVDISSLDGNKNHLLKVDVVVMPEDWVENNVCFSNMYDNYTWSSNSGRTGNLSLKKWCDTTWYNLPAEDGSGMSASSVASPVVKFGSDVNILCPDLPADGHIDENVDSLTFDVVFRVDYKSLAARSPYFDSTVDSVAVARYSLSRFKYLVEIIFMKDGKYSAFKSISPESEYVITGIEYPEYPEGGVFRSLENETGDIHVRGKVYIGDLMMNEGYGLRARITVTPDRCDETLTGEWIKHNLGVLAYSKSSDFYSKQTLLREVKPLDLTTDALMGRENKHWIYNHPDAELHLRLGRDGLKKDSYAAFFAGYGPSASAFPGDDVTYSPDFNECTRMQSLNGTLLPDGSCSESSALTACNSKRYEWFGDMRFSGGSCPYYCTDYGSYALYGFFVDNFVKTGEFSPGETYLRRFARPRNLLLRTKRFGDYYDADFYVDNIFKTDDIESGADYAVDRLYHLRDFEFVIPAGKTYYRTPNIKAEDEFTVSARRFVKRANFGYLFDNPEKSLFFCGVTPSMKWDADYPEDRSVFDEGDYSADYFTKSKSPSASGDIYPKNDLKFIVVPALRFDTLTTSEKDSLYHCANAVYDVDSLLEDDVIHLYAKNISLDTRDGMSSVVSRSDYAVRRYWEYSTEPENGKWKRVDTDEQLNRFFFDCKDLPWVPEKMKNDSDLWINSAILLEQGVKTGKRLHFRQAAAVTRFTSDTESELYSERLEDGRWCVKVVSDDYYTVVAIPNINKDNIVYRKGGEDIYLCWGDTIPAGQDSIVYSLQTGGDIRSGRELDRLLDYYTNFRAERVTRDGVLDITSGIKVSGRAAHVGLFYYRPPQEKAPEKGDTITYRFYVSSCRNIVMDSIRIITYPHDRMSIDSLVVEDGYIALKDAFKDSILVRAQKGTSPKLLYKGADTDNYVYMWHKRTNISDYKGMQPLPSSYIPYWTDVQLVDFSKTISLECDSETVDKYYNDYYNLYSTDPSHPEFGGFATKTKFDSPYVSTTQRRAYCYFILNEVNECRKASAVQQYMTDNLWQGWTSQTLMPWVRLTPHDMYLTSDENSFYVRRHGRYGSPCGQDCPSDSIIVTVRYYDKLRDNVISFGGADSVTVLYLDPVPELEGTPTVGGYGDPYNCPDNVSRRYMWEMTTDTLSGVWTRVQNVDGMGGDFLQQPYGDKADKYTNLPNGVLTAMGGQFFLRRVVWSVLDSDLDSRIESVSNVVKVVSARLLDEGDLVHNSKPGMRDITLCPDASDFIVVCEPEENIDHNSRYVWDLRYDDGTEVPHTEFSDNHDYVRHRDNPQYPDLNNAVIVDNVSEDYTASVYRINVVTGMFSDTVVSRVHVWRMEPEFLYATAMDGFSTWHTVDNPLLTVSAGTLTRLRAVGVVEQEDESLRLWTLQVQDFVGGQEIMGYRSQQASPYLYLYNAGANRIALHAENMHGCKADVEGSVYVSGYAGKMRSAFVPDDDDMYSWGIPSDLKGSLVSLYPTVVVSGGEVHVVSSDEDYDIVVTDETGRTALTLYGVSGNVTFTMNVGRGVYNAAVGSHVFRILVK